MKSCYQVSLTIPTADYENIILQLELLGVQAICSEELPKEKILLQFYLEKIAQFKKKYHSTEYQIQKLLPRDWQNTWLADFQGTAINKTVYIQALGQPAVKDYPVVIKMDARSAFGDGRHPTTILCVNLLQNVLQQYPADKRAFLKLLDAGTGTGVLAILAGKLGVKNILALDIDQDSIKRAKVNLKINQLKFPVKKADITQLDATDVEQYDLIIANLLTEIILKALPSFAQILKPGGKLIISGISSLWKDDIISALKDNNLHMEQESSLNNWEAFLCCKVNPD